MVSMPKKKTLTVRRVLTLAIAYITLCVGGGVATSLFLLPAVFGVNNVAKAIIPSLAVEGIDFDVTSLPQKSTLYASDGTSVITEFWDQNREVVPLKNISKAMQQAVVAREDKRFFSHSGVDVQGVFRAFFQTYVKGGDQQGGSSLTQQYVKNMLIQQAEQDDDPIAQYHASEDTIARKLREMLIAVQVEKKYSKAEILQGYLNIAQFGGNSLYGVQSAAKRYFNTTADQLTVVQAATIAAITKNPNAYDPSVEANQEESQNQRNIVLQLMHEQGFITDDEYNEAVNTPLVDTLDIQSVSTGCMAANYDAGYFCDYVVHKILNSEEFGKTQEAREKLLKEGGLKIVTTLDIDANTLLNETAHNTIPADDASGMEIVMASVKPGTGEVLGFGLNRTYDATEAARDDQTKDSMNYAVDRADGGGMGFSIGSSWKPINLVAWMEAGHSVNENLQTTTGYSTSLFACDRYSGGTDTWSVTNALTNGTVSPETPALALARSHNTTQASMGTIIGLCKVADTATELGYHDANTGETLDQTSSFVPAMLVGNVNVSPLTMASIYAVFASNGVQCDPIAVKKVTDSDGNDIEVPSANCHQAVDPEIIQTLAWAMNQGVTRSDGAATVTQLANGRKTFAKTGTHENQLVTTGGFIPNEIATFVLVGDVQNPVGHPIENIAINGEYHSYWDGSTIAAPAWRDFMNAYAERKQLAIDNDYGQAASKYSTTSSTVTRIGGGSQRTTSQ
jgi:membrane peptidoglycan carboxypeptidase